MKKIFIYYSNTGNGDTVAEYLKDKADIRKVIPKKDLPKSFFFKIMTGGFYTIIDYKSKLVNFDSNIDEYDEVIIGSPIWNARLSSPINTVLDKLDLSNKKVTFIFCSGSGTSPEATKKVQSLFKNVKVIDLQEPSKNLKELDKIKKEL